MNSKEYLETYLKENVRIESLRHISDYISNYEVKRIIEFGTSRVSFEGNSTIFLGLLSRENSCKFTSVDIEENNIISARDMIKNFDLDLLNYIEFICDDQYNYMNNYTQECAQYVYLDGDDQKKHEALKTLINSKILDSKALICVDDMALPYGSFSEINGVIQIANDNLKNLNPLKRSTASFSSLNLEQIKFNSLNNEFLNLSNNRLKNKEGVKQFEYQILLEWNRK